MVQPCTEPGLVLGLVLGQDPGVDWAALSRHRAQGPAETGR